ncbi:MAG: DUF4189 domain-containing protein [Alphaproteobacteria bacterium]|nr:DUF4189 domain-containing protein [Alphaproteobacteria bacterium]
MVSWRKAVGLAAMLMLLGSASAAERDSYGSIAFSPSTGANGYVYGAGSKEEAEDAALSRCDKHAGDCRTGINFWNSCGAVALGDNAGWGSAWAEDGDRAQDLALSYCREHTRNCRIIRWQCSLP